jgi:hypothetical protein
MANNRTFPSQIFHGRAVKVRIVSRPLPGDEFMIG